MGLIPDGLRRWANDHGTTFTDAYLLGAEKVAEILVTLQRNGVQTVSVYNLSRANLARLDVELDAVYAASVHFFATLIPAMFDPAVCGVRIHGDLSVLPDGYRAAARAAEKVMIGNDFRINVLAAYDGDDELRAAHDRAQREGCDIKAAFEIPNIDVVIRTTPEPLLSGFLPFQCQYARLLFLDTPLNDLTMSQIDGIVGSFRGSPQLHGL